MPTYQVLPNAGGWRVTHHGQTISNHRLKDRAIEAADSEAQPGETIEIRRADGTIQRTKTV